MPYSSSSSLCGKRWRRADTNIVEVSFRQLTAPSNMHTGDPVYCEQCQAVLSTVSEVQHNNGEQVSHRQYTIDNIDLKSVFVNIENISRIVIYLT